MEELYSDLNIRIQVNKDKSFTGKWINSKVSYNESYMESKMVEAISNKYPGAWPVKDLKEAEKSRGLKCFIVEKENNFVKARWI